jgi:hypothetical protein
VAFVVVEVKAFKSAAEVGQSPVWAVKVGFLEHQKCSLLGTKARRWFVGNEGGGIVLESLLSSVGGG